MSDDTESLSDKCFLEFLSLIHAMTGITIPPSRKVMVEGRLRKRMREISFTSFETYLDQVKGSFDEKVAFVDLVTTNETSFFRTPRIWEHIKANVLPEWQKTHPGEVFRVWSAAASSGEEATSMGILLQEFKLANPSFNWQIVGSDISEDMVNRCKGGKYLAKSIDAFQKQYPDYFEKYLVKAGEDYKAIPEIRNKTTFKQHNLFNLPADKTPFDLILIRNVLIYFSSEDQEKVISNVCSVLKTDGTLIIGESESLNYIKTDLVQVSPLIYETKKKAGKVA